jgi:hypothetical protein
MLRHRCGATGGIPPGAGKRMEGWGWGGNGGGGALTKRLTGALSQAGNQSQSCDGRVTRSAAHALWHAASAQPSAGRPRRGVYFNKRTGPEGSKMGRAAPHACVPATHEGPRAGAMRRVASAATNGHAGRSVGPQPNSSFEEGMQIEGGKAAWGFRSQERLGRTGEQTAAAAAGGGVARGRRLNREGASYGGREKPTKKTAPRAPCPACSTRGKKRCSACRAHVRRRRLCACSARWVPRMPSLLLAVSPACQLALGLAGMWRGAKLRAGLQCKNQIRCCRLWLWFGW